MSRLQTSLIVVVALAVISGLIFVGFYFTVTTERVKFWTESFLSAFVLAAIIVQAYVYFRQRDEMQRQREAMREQLEAVREQTKVIDKSLVISTRAYVGVHSVSLKRDDPQVVTIKIENIGHLPAEDVEIAVDLIGIMPDDWVKRYPALQVFYRHKLRESYGSTKLFKGNLQIMYPITLSSHFSKEEIPLLVQGQAILGLGGHIDYTDGFHSERQRTEFNFLYDPPQDAWFSESPNILAVEAEDQETNYENPN